MLYPQEVSKLEISLSPLHNFVAGHLFTAEGSNMFRFPIGVGNDDVFWVGDEDVFWVGNDDMFCVGDEDVFCVGDDDVF